MDTNNIKLLKENLDAMDSAISWLERSIGICNRIGIKADYVDEEYDAFETLSSRYVRTIDLIVRRLLRTVDLVELERPGTLIDTVNRAARRGLIDNVDALRTMTDLRNEIAHDYIKSELVEAFENILHQAPQVIALAKRIKDYAEHNI